MKSPYKKFSLLVAIIFFLFSCGGGSSGRGEAKAVKNQEEIKIIADIDQLLKDLPPPSLVPFTLKSIDADFDRDLVSPLGADKYLNNNHKMALNMGVYASDISYFAAYEQEEDCITYFKGVQEMVRALGDSAVFGDDLLAEFKSHLSDNDGLLRLLSSLIVETSLNTEEDHHLTVAGLALTGSFVEGLYQAVVTIETFSETSENVKRLEPLVKIVLNEEKALLGIIKLLQDLPFDDTIADMITELSILDRLYKGDLQRIEEKMGDDPDFILTKDDMRDITLEVKRIRKLIVE